MDVTSYSSHSLPNSQLSAGLKHNAQAALKLRTEDSGRSKWWLAAGSAPKPVIRDWSDQTARSQKSGLPWLEGRLGAVTIPMMFRIVKDGKDLGGARLPTIPK